MRRAWIVVVLLLGGWELFRSPNKSIERGNRAFHDGQYAEAEGHYRRALGELDAEPGAHFDLGAALHQQALSAPEGDARKRLLDHAAAEFRRGTESWDAPLKGASHYNLGNTHFERGDLGKAIEEYQRAIKTDPTNRDARYNLELALRRQEQQEHERKKEQQQHNKQQQEQQQAEQEKEEEEQQQQDQEQQEQQAPQQPQDQEQQEQQAPQQPQDQEQEQPPDQAQEPKKEPSKDEPARDPTLDDADRKLDALERASKDLQVRKQRGRVPRRRGRPKDW